MSYLTSKLVPPKSSFSVNATGTSQIVPVGGFTPIDFTTKGWDLNNEYNLAGNFFLATFEGYYRMSALFKWSSGESSRITIAVNAIPRVAVEDNISQPTLELDSTIYLEQGDFVQLQILRASNTNDGTVDPESQFSGYLVREL